MHPELGRLPAVEDGLHDIRRQQCQHEDTTEIATVQFLGRR
jgi:hypothetical protein